MTLSKFRPFWAMLLIFTAVACKKDNSSNEIGSGGDITLSVNSASATDFDKPTYNVGTESNYKTGVSFTRCYYINSPTELDEESYISFSLLDENIFQQPLPYHVKNMTAVVNIKIPHDLGDYVYSTIPGGSQGGHMSITVTSTKGTRIKGSYSGVIYNGDWPAPAHPPELDSLRVNGSFDITLPAYYGD